LRTTAIALVLAGVLGSEGGAQARRSRPSQDRCVFQLVKVDRQGVRTTPSPGVDNYFAGGNVHARCIGRKINIYADSIASYGGTVVQFISQGSKVRYRDSVTSLDTDFGTYFKDGERFEAQGNVLHRDLKTGSTITGQRVDYLRPVRGLRTEMEVVAYNRPTVTYVVKDSANRPQAPYVIVGNTVRVAGSDAVNAGGSVTIDREDLKGAADSLWLDSGEKQGGQLIGRASLRSVKGDSGFSLTGKLIDIALEERELNGLKAKDGAKLVSQDVTLDADSIAIDLVSRQAERTRAWGQTIRPKVVSADYQVVGDSLLIETPGQKLSRVRAYGKARAGFAGDSATAKSRRDWIAGEIVTVSFSERDSAGVRKNAIRELEAEQEARSFYEMPPERGQTKASINYTRANRIVVTMKVTSDSNTVQQVDAFGAVDGIHLQPALPRRDTSLVRPVRPDTGRVASGRRPGGVR
jgi:hypothetical protein